MEHQTTIVISWPRFSAAPEAVKVPASTQLDAAVTVALDPDVKVVHDNESLVAFMSTFSPASSPTTLLSVMKCSGSLSLRALVEIFEASRLTFSIVSFIRRVMSVMTVPCSCDVTAVCAASVAICISAAIVSADGRLSCPWKKTASACVRSTSICTLMAMLTSCSWLCDRMVSLVISGSDGVVISVRLTLIGLTAASNVMLLTVAIVVDCLVQL